MTQSILSREIVLGFLNAALATEMLSLVRCKRRYYSTELVSELREQFLEQVIEESMHTDRIVGRIMELGGMPDFTAQGISELGGDGAGQASVHQVISEEVAAQKLAIDSYRNIVRLVGGSDPATCEVLEDVIRRDQHYVERLANFLAELPKSRPESRA